MEPLISVIMPVYHVEAYIADSVRSVCNQTFQNFELILVDDGSGDHSIENAEQVLREFSVTYRVVHQENRGLAGARNTGIRHAKGEWVICIDSDDSIHPQTLEILAQKMEPTLNVLAFAFHRVNEIPSDYGVIPQPVAYTDYSQQTFAEAFFTRKLQLAVPTLLIRRSFWVEKGLFYDEQCRFSEDQLFVWSLIACTEQMRFVTCCLYDYLDREGSIMTASGIDKILTGYQKFVELDGRFAAENTSEKLGFDTSMVLPRWIFGTLHSSAKQMQYADFQRLCREISSHGELAKLKAYPDWRIQLLVMVYHVSQKLFYTLSKWI